MRRAAILLVGLGLLLPATAGAKTIHQHEWVGLSTPMPREVVQVVQVAPGDSDDDGCRNSLDNYNGPGCNPPPAPAPAAPAPAASVAAPTPTTTSVAPTSGGCPSYMAGEASSPDAVNASSGASGCYQVLPSTAAAMGPACADVNATSCVAAICATAGNAAWASSGSTPCDYIRP